MPKRAEKAEVATKAAPTKRPTRKAETEKPKDGGEKKIVEKFPLYEKAKKFLEKVEKGLSTKVYEFRETEVGKAGEKRQRMVFLNFAETKKLEDGELVGSDLDYNIATIKEVLYYYHTASDNSNSNVVALQVLAPEGEPALLVYQEFGG